MLYAHYHDYRRDSGPRVVLYHQVADAGDVPEVDPATSARWIDPKTQSRCTLFRDGRAIDDDGEPVEVLHTVEGSGRSVFAFLDDDAFPSTAVIDWTCILGLRAATTDEERRALLAKHNPRWTVEELEEHAAAVVPRNPEEFERYLLDMAFGPLDQGDAAK